MKINHLAFYRLERELHYCKWVVDRPIGPGGLRMRLKWLLLLLPIFLCAALPAQADLLPPQAGQDYVWVNGSYSSVSNGFAIGPYGGSLNGSPSQFYCVDFKDEISGNTGWYANATGLTSSSGYGQTLEKNGTTYLQMAWLITQMTGTSNKTLQAQYQWSIWYLSLGSILNSFDNPYGTDAYWAQQASKAVQGGFSVSGWSILTPTGGYGQEFILPGPGAATPEPTTFVLLSAGLVALLALGRRK